MAGNELQVAFPSGEVKCPDFGIPPGSSELVARCQVRLAHSCRLELSARARLPCQRPEREVEIALPQQRSSHGPGVGKRKCQVSTAHSDTPVSQKEEKVRPLRVLSK